MTHTSCLERSSFRWLSWYLDVSIPSKSSFCFSMCDCRSVISSPTCLDIIHFHRGDCSRSGKATRVCTSLSDRDLGNLKHRNGYLIKAKSHQILDYILNKCIYFNRLTKDRYQFSKHNTYAGFTLINWDTSVTVGFGIQFHTKQDLHHGFHWSCDRMVMWLHDHVTWPDNQVITVILTLTRHWQALKCIQTNMAYNIDWIVDVLNGLTQYYQCKNRAIAAIPWGMGWEGRGRGAGEGEQLGRRVWKLAGKRNRGIKACTTTLLLS